MGLTAKPIGDDEWLTQYGTLHPITSDEVFPHEPRWNQENDLSMLWGWLSVAEATAAVRGRHPTPDRDAVRYTTAGTLRAEGFTVEHTPRLRNRNHVSVTLNGDWDASMCQALDASFTEAGQD